MAPVVALPAGSRTVPFQPVEVLPGLVVRLLEESERTEHLRALERVALYADPARQLDQWWRAPTVWPTVVAWHGRILQYDYFHLLPERKAWAGLTLRPERNRSRWFWRECRRPVLDQLLAAGYRTMASSIRADRADWIAVMRELWAATETGRSPDGKWVRLAYHLRTCRAKCEGFPARRTLGPTWVWIDARLVVREATAEDLPAIRALIAAQGLLPAREAMALRILEETWFLDQAAILLGYRDGALRHARSIRWHWGDRARLASISALNDEADQDSMVAADREWCRRVGYVGASSFVAARDFQPGRRAYIHLERWGARVVRHHEDRGENFIEVDLHMDPYPEDEWRGAPHALKD